MIHQLNEVLSYYNNLYESFTINEMAIYYGTSHGQCDNIIQGIELLKKYKNGYVQTNQYLTYRQPVTQQEIKQGLYNRVHKDIMVDKKLPIFLVWGEPDKCKQYKKLEGHGIVHIIQGHEKQVNAIQQELNKVIVENKVAKLDKRGNYTIAHKDYRFCFKICLNEPNLIPHAVLISAFKKV